MYMEDESHSYHISSLMDRKMKGEKLYDEQNRVVTTQKGTELYTHYDKVESSVRERYEKVQKQQKKTTQKKTVTTKKAR